jgi:hypothetical protein
MMSPPLCQVVPDDVIERLLTSCRSGDYDKAQGTVTDIVADGFAVSQILSQVGASTLWIDVPSKLCMHLPLNPFD